MSGYLDKLREHEFDGIQEFDNYLPQWWLWSFYLACIFSAIYWLWYHGTGFGTSAKDRFNQMVAEKMAKEVSGKPVTKELLEKFAANQSAVAEGKKTFESVCAACHLKDGSGLAGPNLTDKFWIHGGGIEDIYKIVSKGSPTNPTMVPWEASLKRTGVLQVVAYVMTLKNTNREGKPPEGKEEK